MARSSHVQSCLRVVMISTYAVTFTCELNSESKLWISRFDSAIIWRIAGQAISLDTFPFRKDALRTTMVLL
eukprot:6472568-Amphidinium_carterae.1